MDDHAHAELKDDRDRGTKSVLRYAAYCMDTSQYVKLAMQGGQSSSSSSSSSHDHHHGQFGALAAEIDRIQKLVNDVCPTGTDWCILLVNRDKGIQKQQQMHAWGVD